MAGMVLCEPTELYNILNQFIKCSRLAEPNYLCLLDARIKREYNESHVITAKRALQNDIGEYLRPTSVELESMNYCVVYDGNTDFLGKNSPAIECAKVMAKSSRHPIRILKGGFERFSASYHFFRTKKILWMPQEIENFQPYPVEIIPGLLYMGDSCQASDPEILKDLKIQAHINVSEELSTLFTEENGSLLHIPLPDSNMSALIPYFSESCNFIGSYLASSSPVLVSSRLGISRSSTVIMAFLMYQSRWTLEMAWHHVQKCRNNMRPNRGFVQQLSEWESELYGTTLTDISDPNY
ncbi:serine/threonine/tyrosine-interacting-like protein 1 [Rhinatrema bivittatum]|uniref:serine/threonine/tyrosine-interacting-like protein 1 n=1 Tax=Rhinatrema bivittatum TaxID=194408 RepID=UPI00112ED57A|nr:serine/threonine/tyrosine-interacting-like protein 1 [Rhinatrema bivittatum]XP_029468553.1 serine/threonine/tyrosine-interacting-like protein 1 [Rhinatrema bivittatum]XP_029468554.1 serine/threonine/tyrosine-interacting-like protein 1 [Rhinatrema bivittatum]